MVELVKSVQVQPSQTKNEQRPLAHFVDEW